MKQPFQLSITVVAGLFAASTVQALSPPPPLPEEALTDFYEAMNGDEWHRNDGWLDPDVDICDWYGITCVTEGVEFGGYEWIGYIRLPDNNLQGELDESLIQKLNGNNSVGVPSRELDLSGNAISGELPVLPVGVPRLILADNQLEGPLPPAPVSGQTPPPIRLEYLELENNRFDGEVPSNWEALSLLELNLSTNRLEGAADPAFRALDPAEGSFIDLSDNAFAGELPEWVPDLALTADAGLGSIDICWTELTVTDSETHDWIAERHVGGADFEQCLTRARRPIGAQVSGSWFDPERSGEGFSIMLLDNGVPLIYWFTHRSLSRQMWLIGTGRHEDTTLSFPDLLRTEGQFGHGHGSADYPVNLMGESRMDGVAEDRLHLSSRINYNIGDLTQPDDGPIIFGPNPLDFRTDLVRLSELAGTTCDNQSEFQQYSGAWYNPEHSGEGLIVEVQPDDRVTIYWFTYQPADSGEQAWMIGQGHIAPHGSLCTAPGCESFDAIIEIDEMFQPIDTGLSFPADLTGVENIDWGEVFIGFGSADAGVHFDSEFEEYGQGDYPIERLARPKLAECEAGEAK